MSSQSTPIGVKYVFVTTTWIGGRLATGVLLTSTTEYEVVVLPVFVTS